MRRMMERLALHRPELRAWALYDWANSAFVTIIISTVFPIFFAAVANAHDSAADPSIATGRLAVTTAIALAIVAVLAPILGAIADVAPIKKKLLAAFMVVGVIATAAMAAIPQNGWILAALLFGVARIGAMGSFVFYDSLLPHIATEKEVDRVSVAGYALGYFGGGVLLAALIVVIEKPELVGLANAEAATRVGFVAVAAWWALFSIPLFRRVREPTILGPQRKAAGAVVVVKTAFSDLAATLRSLRRYRHAFLFLIAFLIYNDGIGTIIQFAVIYGSERGLETGALIKAALLVQFIGIPCTFAFGQVAGRIGARASIYVGLVVYSGVSLLAYFMTTEAHFYLLAVLVGTVQGGVQALSRSLFASMIPRSKSSEFFGLFAVFEKFSGIIGPAVFAAMIAITGSSREAILVVIGFFVVGGALLATVNIAAGQSIARAENAAAEARATATETDEPG